MSDGGATRPAEGLVIGKFYPLHAGHQLLVDTARAACDTLTVAVLAAARESIPLETRARWVRALWPDVRVVAAYDEAPMSLTDPGIWAMHVAVIQAAVGRPVDVVFSSEAYGDELARRLGATHVAVDPGRARVPLSATMIRTDPAAHWHSLPPAVRAWFVRRVVVVGAESTGTTTLATALASHYGADCVPGYGRLSTYDLARALRRQPVPGRRGAGREAPAGSLPPDRGRDPVRAGRLA